VTYESIALILLKDVIILVRRGSSRDLLGHSSEAGGGKKKKIVWVLGSTSFLSTSIFNERRGVSARNSLFLGKPKPTN